MTIKQAKRSFRIAHRTVKKRSSYIICRTVKKRSYRIFRRTVKQGACSTNYIALTQHLQSQLQQFTTSDTQMSNNLIYIYCMHLYALEYS